MAGTPTIVDRIVTRLTTDGSFMAIVTGGVYRREIKREGPGATPNAFAPDGARQPRVSAVVVDNGDVPPGALGPAGAFDAFPQIFLYAPTTDNGKTAIADAIDLMRTGGVLNGWKFPMSNGTGAIVTWAGNAGVRDDPVITGAVVDVTRWQVSGLWGRLD